MTRRWFSILVILLALWVMRSFLVPLAWAAVLAVTAWPLLTRLSAHAPSAAWLAPLGFTLGVGLILMLPLSVVAVEAARDSQVAIGWIGDAQQHGIAQPDWLSRLPFGDHLAAWWQHYAGTPQAAAALLGRLNTGSVFSVTGTIGAEIAHGALLFFVTLIALFAMLRHGEKLAGQFERIAATALGEFGARFTDRLVSAIRGTVAGTVLIALGEGTLIGIGYAAAGVPRPFLFAILTIAFAMLPFGAWLVFSIATAILLIQGAILPAVLLFGFSVAVMLIGDNLVQPAVIGNAIRLPFLLALLGTFGGIESFGLVGLFLGPVIMAILLLVWHEAMDGHEDQAAQAP
ncbi:AI-2E family transporter [Sphingomonas colocasiae]|uniref:AI-2E family transporter n=1 Tax=Sphingomonas colocasiae TaxID=1848973 RepID=A0ABS7Q0W6_9SPHN|nr:AI-2E family transporter [Sphingomonas colocasiae]MBY8826172.1 AI-2E family transporter [Sphingomonas colocasiae]